MTNVVLITKNRPRLTYQTLWTLMNNTRRDYTLTVVDDGSSDYSMQEMFAIYQERVPLMQVLRVTPGCGVVGRLRNLGVYWSEKQYGRGEALYFSDNDIYFIPGWDSGLRAVYNTAVGEKLAILGGNRHPFHQVNEQHFGWSETDAVAGYSMWMSWDVWDAVGPFDAEARGVGQSEDFAMCLRARIRGMKVGYISEPVLRHCGVTNSDGKAATGAEAIRAEQMHGVLYE